MNEEMYKNLIQAARDAIIAADMDGRIIIFNKASEELFGYSANEVIGKYITILIPERYRKIHEEGLQRFVHTGIPKIMGKISELYGLTKEGREFPIELSLSFVKENGYIFIGIIRDLTYKRQIESELKKRLEELEKFHNLTIDRELKMIEIKKEIASLKERMKGLL